MQENSWRSMPAFIGLEDHAAFGAKLAHKRKLR
jgi:hypothetical protein